MSKASGLKALVVVTADQIGSRRHGDRVPAALDALAQHHGEPDGASDRSQDGRSFARTAGDEIQGLLTDSADVIRVLETLVRLGDWRIGVGIGSVERPIPRDVRAASGPAFVAARDAVIAAETAPQDLAVVSAAGDADNLRAALWLLAAVWRRRTPAGWEAVEASASGAAQQDVAKALGVTPSAVSQRLSTAAYVEAEAGKRLATALLEQVRTSSAAR